MHRFRKLTLMAAQVAAVTAVLIGSLGAGVAQAANPGSPATTKPAPVAPHADRNALAAPLATKPQAGNKLAPAIAWTANLSASSTSLWPTQYTTLTATANGDVGPTPYYLGIYDTSTGASVVICGSGTTCSASVTQTTATTHYYRAYVASYSLTNPPANIQASSAYVGVTWRSISVSLSASPTTTFIGGTATLSTTTSADVGPTPFWTQIFDLNTGARIAVCGFGTTCSGTTSQAVATTHKFVAYVASYSSTLPLSNVQATSTANFVTWANTGYRVTSLTTSRTSYGHDTVTATSNVNVGPTPYYIEVFNVNTGARVAVCGVGTSCSANVALGFGQNNFVAFISSYDTALPPLNTQASSSVVSDWFFPIF
jgi:hypothetical protein